MRGPYVRGVTVMLFGAALCGCSLMSSEPPPPSFEHLMFRADERIKGGNNVVAKELLSEAAKLEPARKEPWLRRAEMEFDSENYGAAILASQEALQREAGNVQAESILTVSGLRIAVESLGRLRDEKDVNGPIHQEAKKLAVKLRETLGAKALLPKAKPAPRKRVPVAAPAETTNPAGGNNNDPFSSLPR